MATGVNNMSKSEIDARVKQIEASFDSSQRLNASDVNFLKQLNRSHGKSYNYGHRVLAGFYFNLKKYECSIVNVVLV